MKIFYKKVRIITRYWFRKQSFINKTTIIIIYQKILINWNLVT